MALPERAPETEQPQPRTAAAVAVADSDASGRSWRYPEGDARDLRIDFIRGVVMFILVVVHMEIFSLYNFLVWERVGVVSGGEGFVILSGVVLGMVHRRKIERGGWKASAAGMVNRATQLYRVNIAVILAVGAFMVLPLFFDPAFVTTFTDRGSGTVYNLFPVSADPIQTVVAKILLLKVGPHQFQIMGLYVVLIALAPLAMWAFTKDKALIVLSICWILYFKNWAFPARPTGAQFEYAFPLLTWQLTFFHGLAFGYYKNEIAAWFRGGPKTLFYALGVPLFLAFLFFTWNNPNPAMPDFAKLSFIEPDVFRQWYGRYFTKNQLGILRLVNYLLVLVFGYALLTRFWKPIDKAFGWFLVPIGQASLYVFIWHIFLLMVAFNVPYLRELTPAWGSGNLWLNTLAHTAVLMALWAMVKTKFLFRWIPR